MVSDIAWGTARGSAGTDPLRHRGLRAPIEQHSVQVSDRPLVALFGCGSLSILIAVSGCGSSPARSSSTAANSRADVDVVLTGPLSGSFATCRLDKDGDVGDTVLGGYVVEASGTRVGTAVFVVVHVGSLIPGDYLLAPGIGLPTGSRAVGTLTVSPLTGRTLPVVTFGQRDGSAQAVFLTQTGELHVAPDGSTTITADLIDQQATQQIPDHPVISGSWRCSASS
jgi:hypothetical protein